MYMSMQVYFSRHEGVMQMPCSPTQHSAFHVSLLYVTSPVRKFSIQCRQVRYTGERELMFALLHHYAAFICSSTCQRLGYVFICPALHCVCVAHVCILETLALAVIFYRADNMHQMQTESLLGSVQALQKKTNCWKKLHLRN